MSNIKKHIIKKETIKIDEGVRRTGKDEMNLVELPFTLLTKRNPKELKTIERNWVAKNKDGKEKQFYKIITGSAKWGLPTFIGEEVFLACMELSYKQGFKKRKVYTNKHELIKLMGWVYNGQSCKRLTKAFDQLLGVVIKTNAFWDNEAKKYRELGFGIIDDYMFFEDEKKGRKSKYSQAKLPFGNFNWNEKFFEYSIQKGNIKTLDVEVYFSLKSYVAKRLYRYADKKIYQQQSFELDLFRLAFEKLEMSSNYKYPSKVIEKLKPAIQELQERNLANITIKQSKTESGYKVCFNPISKPQITLLDNFEIKADTKSKAMELVKYFHHRLAPEIKKNTGNDKEVQQADRLLLKYSFEEIKHIIKYAIDQAKQTKFDIQYFGAVLNYSDKAIAQLKQKIEQKEKIVKLKKEIKIQEQVEHDYNNYRQKQIEDYIKQISPIEYKQSLKDISKQVFKDNPFITNKESTVFKHMVDSYFNNYLIDQGKINILPIEKWQTVRSNDTST